MPRLNSLMNRHWTTGDESWGCMGVQVRAAAEPKIAPQTQGYRKRIWSLTTSPMRQTIGRMRPRSQVRTPSKFTSDRIFTCRLLGVRSSEEFFVRADVVTVPAHRGEQDRIERRTDGGA
jgi:hypothetical protein